MVTTSDRLNSPGFQPDPASSRLYDDDFYRWTQVMAEALRSRNWSALDIENLVEEVESLGRQQRQELRNRLGILLGHLLKWEFQPEQRSRSWLSTIRVQRLDIAVLLEDNPSLKASLQDVLEKGYRKGVLLAEGETGLEPRTFPEICSYRLEEVLDDDFYPGETSDLLSNSNNKD